MYGARVPSGGAQRRKITRKFHVSPLRSKVAVFQEGKEPLPRCDLCGIHMPVRRLIRHRKTARCNRNTQMRWRRWDVAIAARCLEAKLSLTGE